MGLKLPWPQKRVFGTLGKGILQFFAGFYMTKLKPLLGKVKQSIQNYLNQNLVIETFLENGFEATLSSKTMLSVFQKGVF